MRYIPFNLFGITITLIIFIILGFSLAILLSHTYILEKSKESKWKEIGFIIYAYSFSANAFIGYILDIFSTISSNSYLLTVIGIFFLTYILKNNSIKIFILNLKNSILEFKSQKEKYLIFIRKDKYTIYFILAFGFFIFNTFYYPISHYNLYIADTTETMAHVQAILFYENNRFVDFIINNFDNILYPQGFYMNIVFLSCFGPENLYIILRFLGPLISLLNCYLIFYSIKKLTNNTSGAIAGMLVFIGSYIFNYYSNITVASTIGFSIALIAINILIENKLKCVGIIAFLFGGALLIHTFSGGIFFIAALFVFYLVQKQFSSIIKTIIIISVMNLPYILLLDFTDTRFQMIIDLIFSNNSLSIENTIVNFDKINQFPTMIFSILKIGTDRTFIAFDLIVGTKEILQNGIFLIIFYIIAGYSKSKYKENKGFYWFCFTLLIIALAYIYNPLVINLVIVKAVLNDFYPAPRMNFFITIAIAYLVGFGFESFIKKLGKIELIKISELKIKQINKVESFVFIILLSIQLGISIGYVQKYGFEWYELNRISDDYWETLLWAKYNINPNSKVLTYENAYINNDLWWNYSRLVQILDSYYIALTFPIQIFRNNTFFKTEMNYTTEILNELKIFEYDFIIIPNEFISNFEYSINESIFQSIFSSSTGEFTLYKISK